MVIRKREQNFINQQDVLEVVDHALSVQEVHSCRQKVPIQRFGEPQVLLLVGDVGDSDNLLERNDLNSSNEGDDIDMTGEQRDEETGNHHEGPYRPGNEGLLLLLIFGLGRFLKSMIASDMYSESIKSYNQPLQLLLRVWAHWHFCWGSRAPIPR